jgi:hypothetical protein
MPIYWKAPKVRRAFRRAFRYRRKVWCRGYLTDRSFTLVSRETVIKIIDWAKVYNRAYLSEKYDCDNFARSLKAKVDEWGAVQDMRYGYAFGTISGRFGGSGPHAICWFINEQGKLELVEPQQRRGIWYPRRTDRGISKFEA